MMAFRHQALHSRWQRNVAELAPLLQGIPPAALLTERAFRQFLTAGTLGDAALHLLSDEDLLKVQRFLRELDWQMDSLHFTAFNQAIARVQGKP